jgi:hypothetical protein
MAIVLKKNIDNHYELPIVDEEIIRYLQTLPTDYWDFVEYDKRYTHNIHSYPAMMIPPISKNLINIIKTYQPNIKNLLDPFAGSGTVLLEGIIANMNVWGIDLNPLACLISKAKCTPIHLKTLRKTKDALLETVLSDLKNNNLKVEIPNFKNINYWFKPYVIRHLQIIKQRIKEIKDKDIRTLFWVAFSETVRNCSNTRNSEFKLFRITEEKLANFNPSVYEVFRSKLEKCEQGMTEFCQNYSNNCKVEILAQDTRNFRLNEKMDLMITSPPYGDSKTTVAYGQFSRLSLQWLDLEDYDYISSQVDKTKLDKYLLGGKNGITENNLPSDKLKEVLEKIAKIDKKRALDVLSFYVDLDKCLKNITKHMKINSYQCWVVGNRTVRKVNIPTNEIISELAAQYNLKTVITIPRNIPNKKMPKENSPTNIKGEKVATMNKENIVILRKVM